MKSITATKKFDAAAAQESNGRVRSLCDLQGSLWSKARANLLTLLMLAGTVTEHRAGGSVSKTGWDKPFCAGQDTQKGDQCSLLTW